MRTASGQKPSRISGFTLVELLVVITIIGILMGLLIPAVQAAREAARRNQCSTQINNLAKATVIEEMNKKRFPGWVQNFGFFPGGPDPSNPDATAYPAHRKLGGWAVSLLPHLDGQATYEIWSQDRYPVINDAGGYTINAAPNLAILQCPSSITMSGSGGRNSYISNNGAQPRAATTGAISFTASMSRTNGVFNNKYAGDPPFPVGETVRIDDLKDGQGNTILFSENLQAINWHRVAIGEAASATLLAAVSGLPNNDTAYPSESRYVQGFVWHYENGNANVQTQSGCAPVTPVHKINGSLGSVDKFSLVMDGTNLSGVARPSSAHSGGVNAGFADGTSKFIVESIDYEVYQALMTPRGKSSNVPFPEYVLPGDAL